MERLPGSMGNGGQVFRVDDVVVRPRGAHDDATISLLHSLVAAGFSAPVPLGGDESGRQRFAWIEGDVGVPPFPAWVLSDEALSSAGRLLRSYHETVAGLTLPGDLQWSDEMSDPEGGTIICHNDVCPENVVYRGGEAVALLDFDFAAPGRPLWDLAHMARMWSPLRPPELVGGAMRDVDPFHRLGVLADAYGVSAADRPELVGLIIESRRRADRFVRRRLAAGEPAFLEVWEPMGGERALDRMLDWLVAHRDAMLAAVQR